MIFITFIKLMELIYNFVVRTSMAMLQLVFRLFVAKKMHVLMFGQHHLLLIRLLGVSLENLKVMLFGSPIKIMAVGTLRPFLIFINFGLTNQMSRLNI